MNEREMLLQQIDQLIEASDERMGRLLTQHMQLLAQNADMRSNLVEFREQIRLEDLPESEEASDLLASLVSLADQIKARNAEAEQQ